MAARTTLGKVRKSIILKAALVIIVIALAASTGWYFKKSRDLSKQNQQLSQKADGLNKELETYKTNPQQAAQAEVDRYVSEVGKLYALPKDEKPSAATVKDKEKLKDQPFFAKAENGDVTLIYANAKLALLYRPSSKQIVNVSSVTIQDQPQPPAPAQP